jgi:hypothetical protein
MPSRREWTLLVLGAASRPLSPVQLQKSLFLLGKWLPEEVGDDFFQFEPYRYGPFDKAVYTEVELLERDALATRDDGGDDGLTAAGRVAASTVSVSENARKVLSRIVAWVVSKNGLLPLCEAVYEAFPDMRARSQLPSRGREQDPDDMAVVDWFNNLDDAERARFKELVRAASETGGDVEALRKRLAKKG